MTRATSVAILALVLAGAAGCGRKGDPLPPLTRVPAAPGGFTAERRAGTIDVAFTVPAVNTDGTRPANIARVDVYALTGPASTPDEDVIRLGTRIASLEVKAPRNPNDVIQPDERDADAKTLVGAGLDQGVMTRVTEDLSTLPPATAESGQSLVRHYVGVSINTRGRRGLISKGVAVPLDTAPLVPARPVVRYDEQAITVTWTRPAPSVLYNVYSPDPMASGPRIGTRLTPAPVDSPEFVDARVEWGAERCYAVAAVDARNGLIVESELSPSTCVTLVDTFPPRAPAGLSAVGGDAAVNLIWDANPEADVSGYVVLRGLIADSLAPITPQPVPDTAYRDVVAGGVRYFYAVRAVDKSGNAGPLSETVEATPR